MGRRNRFKEGSRAFGDISATNARVLKVSNNWTPYKHMIVSSTLDAAVTLTFDSSDTLSVAANDSFALDDVEINGEIQVAHDGSAPTEGSITVKLW